MFISTNVQSSFLIQFHNIQQFARTNTLDIPHDYDYDFGSGADSFLAIALNPSNAISVCSSVGGSRGTTTTPGSPSGGSKASNWLLSRLALKKWPCLFNIRSLNVSLSPLIHTKYVESGGEGEVSLPTSRSWYAISSGRTSDARGSTLSFPLRIWR